MQSDKSPGASVEINVDEKAGGAHQRRDAGDDASRSPGGYAFLLVFRHHAPWIVTAARFLLRDDWDGTGVVA